MGGSTGAAKNFAGTDGSNPSPSSGESATNLSSHPSQAVRHRFRFDLCHSDLMPPLEGGVVARPLGRGAAFFSSWHCRLERPHGPHGSAARRADPQRRRTRPIPSSCRPCRFRRSSTIAGSAPSITCASMSRAGKNPYHSVTERKLPGSSEATTGCPSRRHQTSPPRSSLVQTPAARAGTLLQSGGRAPPRSITGTELVIDGHFLAH